MLDPLVDFNSIVINKQIYTYQQHIGLLIFIATTTRPDVLFTTTKLAQFLTNPLPLYLGAANYLLLYLYNSKHLAIKFSESKIDPIFLLSSDAAFTNDQKT